MGFLIPSIAMLIIFSVENSKKQKIDYLKELEYKYDIDQKHLKAIEYLQRLLKCCKGFAIPKTCGYIILEKDDDNQKIQCTFCFSGPSGIVWH